MRPSELLSTLGAMLRGRYAGCTMLNAGSGWVRLALLTLLMATGVIRGAFHDEFRVASTFNMRCGRSKALLRIDG